MKISCVTPAKATNHCIVLGVTTQDDERLCPSAAAIGEADHEFIPMYLKTEAVGLGLGQAHATPGKKALLVLVGLGDPAKLTQEKLGKAMANGLALAKRTGAHDVSTTLVADAIHADGLDAATATRGVVTGAICGDLAFDQYKSKPTGKDAKKDKPRIDSLQLLHDKPAAVRKAAKDAATIAHAVNDARLLANMPANIMTPKRMATEARSRGRKHGFKVSVKGRSALRKEGFNALCGVAQGSANEEQLITMTYEPEKVTKSTKTLVVVGKGVCFDSGGISLKPGNLMWDMKYDKCGACNVVALMTTLKDLGVKHRVIGVVAAVENMPGGNAQRPGDIVTAKDGTTIEVLNTDAEGRLILADAITYARETFKPDWMVDMATLTGACEIAVGKTHVAIMSKDDDFAESLLDAAKRAGDKGWRLPQGEEFDDGNKGTYADLQNISLSVKAGTSIGGAFVGHFAKDTTFAHLDIASKAWVKSLDYFGEGPTGAGLRIVLQRILDE
ncbi:MAG: leucyl aminopeptidase family protein [Thermoplasmatota archaeon]